MQTNDDKIMINIIEKEKYQNNQNKIKLKGLSPVNFRCNPPNKPSNFFGLVHIVVTLIMDSLFIICKSCEVVISSISTFESINNSI